MFSMLSVAAQLQTFATDFANIRIESLGISYLTMKDVFREKAVQCLMLARYTRGGPFILETLFTILTGETVLSKDVTTDGWLSISVVLHIAMSMGYHRDPDHFPSLSAFEGEMRRRIWSAILQMDLSLSFARGLPRNATDKHMDTREPRNLRDEDFDEDTAQMPPSRPDTEWTPILPLIARRRLMSALGPICDINTDIKPTSYDELIKADELLNDVHRHAIPSVLHWTATPHPITDGPNCLIQRVSVETTYHKARILLYRRGFTTYSTHQPREQDMESIRICLDSSLKILSFQQMLHEESRPLGRLYQHQWKVTHIFNQDVLLATSILCLYLQDVDKYQILEASQGAKPAPTAEDIRRHLTVSHKIWLERSVISAEAGKVARALGIVLGDTIQSAQEINGLASYDFLPGIDGIPPSELGGTFINQCEHIIMLHALH
jgi:hypothetical protein